MDPTYDALESFAPPPSQAWRGRCRGLGPEAGTLAHDADGTRSRRVAGVLLAAGGGRRFGGAKALALFRGERLVERGARMLMDAGCHPVIVVLGAEAAHVRSVCDLGAARIVVNGAWHTGMASSLRAGLERLTPGNAAACVIALADQPLVTPEAVQRLVAAWETGAVVAVATYQQVGRNPVLLDRRVWTDVWHAVTGDDGARSWIRSQPELVVPVPCDDVASDEDIDTPFDLERLARVRWP